MALHKLWLPDYHFDPRWTPVGVPSDLTERWDYNGKIQLSPPFDIKTSHPDFCDMQLLTHTSLAVL